ncbi:hypothetical protein [Mesorhizobium sp. 128a]
MQKIFLATVACVFFAGTAFGGSYPYGSNFSYDFGRYSSATASTRPQGSHPLDLHSTGSTETFKSSPHSGSNQGFDYPAPGYGQAIWGH